MKTLPESEARVLASLAGDPLRARLRTLSAMGWPLSSLASALDPPRSRSTVHHWVCAAPPPPPDPRLPPPPAPPAPPSPPTPRPRAPLPPDATRELAALAPLARRRRGRHHPSSPYSVASERLTALARELSASGVPTAEIAAACGVSYRAMHRRVHGSG